MNDQKLPPIENNAPRDRQSTLYALRRDDRDHDVAHEGYADWLPDAPLVYRFVKRSIDILSALFALLLLSPVLAAIAMVIKISSSGPILFRQQRLGYHGKPFEYLRFRSMVVDSDIQINTEYVRKLLSGELGSVGEQATYKIAHDPRVTPCGRFLRRTSLDELPQFWNVLCGDMSLIGPRPPIPYEWKCYEAWHRQRLSSRPGITGLWQIKGRTSTTFDEMVKLDIEYIKHPSLLLDLKILLATPKAALRSDKAF